MDLQRLRSLAKAATPGDWYHTTASGFPNDRQFIRSKDNTTDHAIAETWGGTGPRPNDAEYIAAASPKILLELLDALEQSNAQQAVVSEDK
jgi:hypothetical protein